MVYRMTLLLQRRVDNNEIRKENLEEWQRHNLDALTDGSLLARTNHAVAAYGHGTLRTANGKLQIGGSIGGFTRYLLDGFEEPDVESFLARR